MKTSRRIIFIVTLLFSVAGFFVRRSQLATELLPGGFLAQGSYLHIILLVLSALLAVGLAVLLFPLEKRTAWETVFSSAPLSNCLLLLASLGLLAGSLLFLLSGEQEAAVKNLQALLSGGLERTANATPAVIVVLQVLQAPMSLMASGCIAAFAICCLYGKKASPLLCMAASIALVIRLIVHFQEWNTDPSIHDYCFQLLASICTMLGTFHLAGFSFDKGKRRMNLFWCLCAVFFCGITVADTLHSGNAAELLTNASLFLLMLAASYQLLFCKGAAAMPAPEDEIPSDFPETSPETIYDEKS